MKKKEGITRRGRQICPCGEEGSSRKGSPGGCVHDGPYVSINGGEVAVPDGRLDWLAAARETTHAHAVSLSRVTRARDRRPHIPPRLAGPCDPCLHVWGKVERQHQMGGHLGGGWRSGLPDILNRDWSGHALGSTTELMVH
jgi:hypothetical protein